MGSKCQNLQVQQPAKLNFKFSDLVALHNMFIILRSTDEKLSELNCDLVLIDCMIVNKI